MMKQILLKWKILDLHLTDIYTGEKKKITPLAFIIKALVASLKKFPSFNSSIDEIENGKMTLKNIIILV